MACLNAAAAFSSSQGGAFSAQRVNFGSRARAFDVRRRPVDGRSSALAAGGLVDVPQDEFDADVLTANGPVVVDFYAQWCGPCRLIEPLVKALANEYEGRVQVGRSLDRSVGRPSSSAAAAAAYLLLLTARASFGGGAAAVSSVGPSSPSFSPPVPRSWWAVRPLSLRRARAARHSLPSRCPSAAPLPPARRSASFGRRARTATCLRLFASSRCSRSTPTCTKMRSPSSTSTGSHS